MGWRVVICGLLVAMSLLAPRLASAADERVDDTNRAQSAFDQGVRAYHRDRFEQAADLFEWAYALEPHPLFLYNAAMARRRLGEPRRIRELVWAFHEQNWSFEALGPRTGTTFQGLDAGSRVAVRARGNLEARRATTVGQRIADRGRRLVRRRFRQLEARRARRSRLETTGRIGVGLATLGLGTLAGAGIAYVRLSQSWNEFQHEVPIGGRREFDRLQRRVRRRQRWFEVLGVGGAGLVAVGTGLLVWSFTRSDASTSKGFQATGVSVDPRGVSARFVW